MVDELEIARLNRGTSTEKLLDWVASLEGPVVATSSFQTQSVPFLHLLSRYLPEVPILFLDTGFHFPETLVYRDQLISLLGLKVVNIEAPKIALHGQDTDACCRLNKVEPLQPALAGARVWLTGIRRDQTQQRNSLQLVNREPSGLLKICPMAAWTEGRIQHYLEQHDLPEHPLSAQGYGSIGCAPCTRRSSGTNSRSGRWADEEKTECGIHYGNYPQAQ